MNSDLRGGEASVLLMRHRGPIVNILIFSLCDCSKILLFLQKRAVQIQESLSPRLVEETEGSDPV